MQLIINDQLLVYNGFLIEKNLTSLNNLNDYCTIQNDILTMLFDIHLKYFYISIYALYIVDNITNRITFEGLVKERLIICS